ncbi:MAG: endonuclease family protein [Parcubacteria group bacterium]|nr:endonuclease family protein [Parcubacteria group bacterium]
MPKKTSKFQKTVRDFYAKHGRHTLPWRRTRAPYKILVSEIMLQQTQADRVIPKYKSFLKKFPTVESLSRASLSTLLAEWQGLGYNRRALNLKRAAEKIMKDHTGKFPVLYADILELPGVGQATAGDMMAFAYNKPAVVIETNIRTVFIHHFFKDRENISDPEIAKLVERTLDTENPREWYYALMDYGSYLKKELGNNTRQSKHYKKQSAFKGSRRQKNAARLRDMLARGESEKELLKLLLPSHVSISMPRTKTTAQKKVGKVMHEYKEGKLKMGRSGKKVKSRTQAVAIGLSEARRAGAKVPKRSSKN